MSDEESKLTRREFVKFSAMASLTSGGLYALTAKSDILAQEALQSPDNLTDNGTGVSYGYNNGMP